jgi:hypothetical protein
LAKKVAKKTAKIMVFASASLDTIALFLAVLSKKVRASAVPLVALFMRKDLSTINIVYY